LSADRSAPDNLLDGSARVLPAADDFLGIGTGSRVKSVSAVTNLDGQRFDRNV
jgi:hypothetical protein